jgi:hypothetical protein
MGEADDAHSQNRTKPQFMEIQQRMETFATKRDEHLNEQNARVLFWGGGCIVCGVVGLIVPWAHEFKGLSGLLCMVGLLVITTVDLNLNVLTDQHPKEVLLLVVAALGTTCATIVQQGRKEGPKAGLIYLALVPPALFWICQELCRHFVFKPPATCRRLLGFTQFAEFMLVAHTVVQALDNFLLPNALDTFALMNYIAGGCLLATVVGMWMVHSMSKGRGRSDTIAAYGVLYTWLANVQGVYRAYAYSRQSAIYNVVLSFLLFCFSAVVACRRTYIYGVLSKRFFLPSKDDIHHDGVFCLELIDIGKALEVR